MLLILLSLSHLATAAPAESAHVADFCGTFTEHPGQFLENPPPPPPPEPSGKQLRGYFTVGPTLTFSEHFALHWGDAVEFDEDRAHDLLANLERYWQVYVDELGHVPPKDSDTFYMNAYIADSYDGAPGISSGTAYHIQDPDFYSLLVFNAERLGEEPSWVQFVAAHEAYHAFQYASENRAWSVEDHWWLESTAQSMSGRAVGDDDWPIDRLHAYVFYPHLALNSWERLDYDVTSSMHRYGAFIQVEQMIAISGPESVVQTFIDPVPDGPLEAMRQTLADEGANLDDVWMDTLSRNLTWDYERGEAYAAHMASHADDPEADTQFAIDIPPAGSTAPAAAPEETLPQAYGANYLRWESPEPGHYSVQITIDATGSQGSLNHALRVQLVTLSQSGVSRYQPLRVERQATRADIEIDDDVQSAWIVVGVTKDVKHSDVRDPEVYGYTWHVHAQAAPQMSEASGCGCRHGGGSIGWMLLGAPLFWMRRRRV